MSIRNLLFSNPISREIIIWASDLLPVQKTMWEKFQSYLKESWPSSERVYASATVHRLYRDFLRWYMRNGFNLVDYFSYAFVSLSKEERETYISESDRGRLHRAANDSKYNQYVADKVLFDQKYQNFISRDWMAVDTKEDRDRFFTFAKKHRHIIAKPRDGQKGQGIKLLECCDETALESAWQVVFEGKLLVEEVIRQNEYIGKLHPESVNTVRISTAIDNDGEAHIMASVIRVGVGDSIVDNGSAGGLFAGIDIDTGIVISPGIDLKSRRFLKHPTTDVCFLGYVIPSWDALKKLSIEVAKVTPQLRYIGWDWVYTADERWELLEGNEPGGVHILQQGVGHGLKTEYEQILLGRTKKDRLC